MRNPESSYLPFMALGLICDGSISGCRPTSHQLGLSYFLTTPVDGAQALHMYDVNLDLKHVSRPIPSSWSLSSLRSFSLISAYQHSTFVVIGKTIGVFHHLRPFTAWCEHDADITAMFVFGNLLITVDADHTLLAWELPESFKDLPSEKGVIISCVVLPPDFSVSSMAHPQSYVNKILLGGHDGRCILLNVRTKKIVHVFESFPSAVTVLTPSPIIDIVAVGTADGTVHLHNFRLNKTIFTVRMKTAMKEPGDDIKSDSNWDLSVRAISFRSDGVETMVTADAMGNLFVWDLNDRRLCSEVRSVHPNGVAFAEFLPSEPLIITTGRMDNAVKIHIFDDDSDQIRLLRSREGHYLPPTTVKFHGLDGFSLISAGLDRELRSVCVVREARNRQFSQTISDKRGRTAKKTDRRRHCAEIGDTRTDLKHFLPPVTGMACRTVRERDSQFGSIVTIHEGLRAAFTWKMENGASHKHVLVPPDRPGHLELSFKREILKPRKRMKSNPHDLAFKSLSVSCVALTPCGNFAFIGLTDGRIHSFNLQSGLHQAAFEDYNLNNEEKDHDSWGRAHNSAVKSVCMDGCGDTLASVGYIDRKVKFWKVHLRTLEGNELIVPQNVSRLTWCETSDLLAMCGEDFSILVYDVPTRALAREFRGHQGPVVDLCLDKWGRNIVTASADGTIRTWDILSGCAVDVLKCSEIPTSISLCPQGEFMASTHINCLSIRLWVKSNGCGHQKRTASSMMKEPAENEADDVANNSSRLVVSAVGDDENDEFQLSKDIVTLSSQPSRSWTVLNHIRELAERNRAPHEMTRMGRSAPFFLPTIKGLDFKFDISCTPTETFKQGKRECGILKKKPQGKTVGYFATLIKNGNFSEARQYLNEIDAPRVDLELKNIEGAHALRSAIEYFLFSLGEMSCFELTQAHLQSFLTSCGPKLISDDTATSLDDLIVKQELVWHRLRSSLNSVDSLTSHFLGQV